jgi:hypothetical protein
MKMVIYMDQYRTATTEPAEWLKKGSYGDEVMQAEWNPAVVHMQREPAHVSLSPALPSDMSAVDVDAFLGRVYGLATLI